jgi:hypothetical protein
MDEMRNAYDILVRNGDVGIDGMLMLKWFVKE